MCVCVYRSFIGQLDTLRPLIRAAVMTFLLTTAANLSDLVCLLIFFWYLLMSPPPPSLSLSLSLSLPEPGGLAGGGKSVRISDRCHFSPFLFPHLEEGI